MSHSRTIKQEGTRTNILGDSKNRQAKIHRGIQKEQESGKSKREALGRVCGKNFLFISIEWALFASPRNSVVPLARELAPLKLMELRRSLFHLRSWELLRPEEHTTYQQRWILLRRRVEIGVSSFSRVKSERIRLIWSCSYVTRSGWRRFQVAFQGCKGVRDDFPFFDRIVDTLRLWWLLLCTGEENSFLAVLWFIFILN